MLPPSATKCGLDALKYLGQRRHERERDKLDSFFSFSFLFFHYHNAQDENLGLTKGRIMRLVGMVMSMTIRRWMARCGGAQDTAAAFLVTVIHTLEQAHGHLLRRGRGAHGSITRTLDPVRAGLLNAHKLAVPAAVGAKFGLDGGAMDAISVQTLARALRKLHVLLAAILGDGERELHVHRRHDLGVGELPYMYVVAAEHPRQALDVIAQLVDVDVVGCGLEENLRRGKGEGQGGSENDDGDEEGDKGVSIKLVTPFCQPDDKRRDDDTNVAKRIPKHVQDHGLHSHVAVVMAQSARRPILLRLAVMMVHVRLRVSSGSSRGRLDARSVERRWVSIIEQQGPLVRAAVVFVGR